MSDMTDELKPVPCGCGGEARVLPYRPLTAGLRDLRVYHYIECDKCGTRTIVKTTEAEAIEAWNRAMGAKDINVPNKERTAKVESVEKPNVFKCSECGQYFHSTAWGSPVEYCSRCGARLEWE